MLTFPQHKKIFSKTISFYMKKTSNEGREESAHYSSPPKNIASRCETFLVCMVDLTICFMLKTFPGSQWCSGHHHCTTSFNIHLCTSSNSACDEPEIRDYNNLWQWSLLEIGLNAFRLSTTLQKQLIIIIIITIIIIIIKDELEK